MKTINLRDPEVIQDIALTAAVLAAHYLNKGASIDDYDLVVKCATDFCRLHPQKEINDWAQYIDDNIVRDANLKVVKPSDWEDYVVMYNAPYFDPKKP